MDMKATENAAIDIGAQAIVSPAAVGPLFGAKLCLGLAGPKYDGSDLLATLTAAATTYTGNAKGAITWGPATRNGNGEIEYRGTVPEFRPSDAVTPNVAQGAWVENGAASKYYFVGQFPAPGVNFADALSALTCTVVYKPEAQSVLLEYA